MIQVKRDDLVMQQRADHGHQHADGGQLHAVAGLVGRGQPLEAENEQHRGRQIRDLDERFAGIERRRGSGFGKQHGTLVTSIDGVFNRRGRGGRRGKKWQNKASDLSFFFARI